MAKSKKKLPGASLFSALSIGKKAVLPAIPYERIKDAVLTPSYELSLVAVNDRVARNLNRRLRQRTYAANVLSLPLTKRSGEIFLNGEAIRREAKKLNQPVKYYAAYLFIHALLHLRGLRHGSTMNQTLTRLLARFGFSI